MHVPAESFSDLTNVNIRQGVEFAEFARDTFFFLAGSEGSTAWHAKFNIRELNLTEREFKREGKEPLLARYAPPFKAEYFSLPSEAIEKARKLQKSQTQ